MAEIFVKTNNKCAGTIQIADEVIAVIAGTAANEVDGVIGTSGHNFTGDIAEAFGVRNLAKGVKVSVADSNVTVDIGVVVKFGFKIQSVAEEVQNRVKTAVETMTGLNASEININVTGVHMGKEKDKQSREPKSGE